MAAPDFKLIYKRSFQTSLAFVRSYVHNDLAAEDIVAETLVKYWQLLLTDEAEPSDALLMTMLRNKALDYLRKESVRMSYAEHVTDFQDRELSINISTLEACDPKEIFSSEVKRIFQQTLDSLPPLTRKIIIMRRFEGMPVKEIAEMTGLSVKGVEYHITKATKVFRHDLKDYLPLLLFLFING